MGYLPIAGNPRYVMLKDGIGYCAPRAAKIVAFDATTLTVLHKWTLPAAADVVEVVGNMGITGGNNTTDQAEERKPGGLLLGDFARNRSVSVTGIQPCSCYSGPNGWGG